MLFRCWVILKTVIKYMCWAFTSHSPLSSPFCLLCTVLQPTLQTCHWCGGLEDHAHLRLDVCQEGWCTPTANNNKKNTLTFYSLTSVCIFSLCSPWFREELSVESLPQISFSYVHFQIVLKSNYLGILPVGNTGRDLPLLLFFHSHLRKRNTNCSIFQVTAQNSN